MFDATVWRLIAHHENRDGALRWSLKNERIAIGCGAIGDIKTQGYESPEDIRDAIQLFYPELSNSSNGGFSLWNFYSTLKNRDLVILRGDKSHYVVEVTGGYFFDQQNIPFADGNYYHQRPVRLTRYDPDVLWKVAGKMAQDGGSIYRTLIRCEHTIPVDEL
jgi:predicted Mrr-cat superfamily restriction endonuclease